MPTSTRFAVAVHILAGLATCRDVPLNSASIAKSANTNAAVIRRLLCRLNEAGFSRAQLGQGGGAMLAKPACEITLLEVYRAVEREGLFTLHRSKPNADCPIGRNIQSVLEATLCKARSQMEAELAKVTIADVARDIAKCDGTRRAASTRRS
jgi:Rrf2 family protein